MANEKMDPSSFESQKPQEGDEGCENVPPASLLGETATPSPNQSVKRKPRLSGLQSALTPVLKYLNIGNKSTSFLNVSIGSTKPNASVSVLSVEDNRDSYACTVMSENLPEITLLDVTCDNTMNVTNAQCDIGPSTPGFFKELKKPMQVLDVNLNSKLCHTMSPVSWLHDEVLPEVSLFDDTCDTTVNLARHASILLESEPSTPFCETGIPKSPADKTDMDNKPNSALTPKSDASSLVLEKEAPTHDAASLRRSFLESSEIDSAKMEKLERSQSSQAKMSTTFSGNLTHSICSASGVSDSIVEDVKKLQLQVTQDISMSSTVDSCKSPLVNGTQTIDKTQPVTEAHPINITHDLSTSSASVRCDASQSLGCSSNNVTYEIEGEPVKTSLVEKPSCVSGKTSGTGNNPNTAVVLNNTFTTVQDNAALQASILQNRTIDLSTSTVPENKNTNVGTKQVSPETSLVLNDTCSDSKSSQCCEMQNETSEKNSLQKSGGSTIVVQASATSISLQNTFESKPNRTKTCEEPTTLDDKLQNAQVGAPPSPVKNETSAEHNDPEQTGEKIQAATVSDDRPAEPRESTFSLNVAAEENASSNMGEVKDSLNNGHPLCESIINHNEGHKANTLILDSTLDFKSDPLVTSTPMSTTKSFNFTAEREEGKTTAAQKMLYAEGPRKPVAPLSSEVPSNIVCDRKTFLRQPSAKSNMLSLKPPSLLSKFKSSSLLPKRPDLLTSGQLTTHPIEALKTNTAQRLQQTAEMPVSYNLRSMAAAASALKQPVSGLRKAVPNNLPSGIQRTRQGLRLPQAKGLSDVSSGSDKPAGGANPLAKTSLPAKKHPLPNSDAPGAKKKRIDIPFPTCKVEASASSDTTSKTKTLKAPTHNQRTLPTKPIQSDSSAPSTLCDNTAACESTCRVRILRPPAAGLKAPTIKPKYNDCSNCTSLEEQLKLKDKEIQHLKEECSSCTSLEAQLKLRDEEIKHLKDELLRLNRLG